MSTLLTDRFPHLAVAAPTPAALAPDAAPVHTPPPGGERRRPGRRNDVSPELIALMRKPDQAARLRVALYDAPGFLLPAQHRRPPMTGRHVLRMAAAVTACSAMCTAAFHMMLTAWG